MSQVTVTGATSLIGHFLLPLLSTLGAQVRAISRCPPTVSAEEKLSKHIQWVKADISKDPLHFKADEVLIHLAPLWTLDTLLSQTKPLPRRVICFSSTSRFSKLHSTSPDEHALAKQLADAEARLIAIGKQHNIGWTLFRPTLVYGAGLDQNVRSIASFIQRFGFFPIVGKGSGQRMPVHAEDLATACIAALKSPTTIQHAYNLSGGETLSYRQMVIRIFESLEKPTRVISIPESIFRWAIKIASIHPRFQHLKPEMASRMNHDLAFDCSKAVTDFGYIARPFNPSPKDTIRATRP